MRLLHRSSLVIVALGALVGLWVVGLQGLLIEPVVMEVRGACGDHCAEVRCVFENQGPVPSRGSVIVDTWAGAEDDPDYAGVRRLLPVALGAGERVDHTLRVEGVPYRGPATMVRCMPGYVAGGYPLRERRLP